MTVSARNWAWDITEVLNITSGELEPCKGGTKLVLLCLAEHENGKEGFIAYPTVHRIADRTGLSVRAVEGHLRILTASGAIRVLKSQRRSRDGKWLRNVYVLAVPEDYRRTDPEWERG